jgi:general secretion pathway protein J
VDGRLERSARRALDGAPLGQPQVLYDGVENVRIDFLSRGQWLPGWRPSPDSPLPHAVRLEMTLRGVGPVTQLFFLPGTAV